MNNQTLNDTIALFTRFLHNLNKYTLIHSDKDSQFSMNPNLSSILDEISQSATMSNLIIQKSNQRDQMYAEKATSKKKKNLQNAFENKDIQEQMYRDINASSFNQSSIRNLHLFYNSFNEFILLKNNISNVLFKVLNTIVKSAFESRANKQSYKKNFSLGKIETISKYNQSLRPSKNKEMINSSSSSKISILKTQRRYVTIDEYTKLNKIQLKKSLSGIVIKKEEHNKQLPSDLKLEKKPLPLISIMNNYPIDTNANSFNVQSILKSKATYKNWYHSPNLNIKVKEQLKKRILTVKKNNITLTQRTMKNAVSYDYFPLFSSNSRIKNIMKK